MFDTFSVSERTQKFWTVTASFFGQMALLALAMLVPLVSTDALPHRLSWVPLPDPPRGLRPRPAPAPVKQPAAVPFQFRGRFLLMPMAIPTNTAIIQDSPDLVPAAGDYVGVTGGFGDPNGSGNSVIDSLLSARGTPVPPPLPVSRPPAQPAPPTRIRMGGSVLQAKRISGPQPVYPPLAKQARVEGTVRLQAVISREGTILNLRAVSGHPLLIPAALAAVEQWVFRPTYLNGDPVEVATEIDVNFTLQK